MYSLTSSLQISNHPHTHVGCDGHNGVLPHDEFIFETPRPLLTYFYDNKVWAQSWTGDSAEVARITKAKVYQYDTEYELVVIDAVSEKTYKVKLWEFPT